MTPLSNRLRHRPHVDPPRLNLTAMVDVFVVLLVFLLKSYAAEGNIITMDQNLELPISTSSLNPLATLTITVTKEAIYVEDKKVEDIQAIQEGPDLLLPGLAKELQYQVDRARFIAGLNPTVKFDGKITVLGDRGLPFLVLEKVMYTCSVSDFPEIALAVFQK
jgi:biopolymer transport protein TolR